MASRRPVPTRGRSAMPPPTTRPRSVLAKSNSSQRSASGHSTPASVDEHAPAASASNNRTVKTAPGHQLQDDAETNIQVFVRCRRRSEREIQENSPIIVTTVGPRNDEVVIETASPLNNLGVVTLPPTRTYPFNSVFGPEADQAAVYHDVVSPMLDEVLQGYNCTLFAYGQTGTGKTYTMQGDLTPTPMGNPSAQAGMIPRVLFRLFHQLETSGSDYSVKISFVELYNEELRDLLAPELAAPIGFVQPMGMGNSKDSAGQGNLKIFDDSSKKGVFIQGLEETSVKDAADALALLTKGSQRRQIAATKFNDHSSRSHSVFSITVHMKETSSMGDDLLKVGKMNLVDLAGSENIGRSGAENKRAREAGMINQSLLTLGRVINALVERSSHIPYRESKLTRLLQDSLGGHTKTCIIATISPARSNMEETLSTLDYAIRAKSIRNKPEVNQRMTRNSLLKEYVAEIERLKADVLAAREKNGIFFSEDTWNQMTIDQELQRTEILETKKQVEIVESQLRNVREEFEQSIGLLMKREGELKETREKLDDATVELDVKEGQLKAVKVALEEEVVVREAYQENEMAIDAVATDLKKVAHDSLSDLGRLFSKLERKTVVFRANIKAVTSHSKTLTSETQGLSAKLDTFMQASNQHVRKLRMDAEQYQAKELESLATISERINAQIEKVREALQTIHAREQASDEAVGVIREAVEETQISIKGGFAAWTENLKQHCETTCKEAQASSMANCADVENAFKAVGLLAFNVLEEAQEYIAAERELLQEAKTMADNISNDEITRLQQQNDLLTRLLESEKQKADRARDELIQRISGLLGEFTAERDRSLRDAFTAMTDSNVAAEGEMARLGKEQGQRLESVVTGGQEWSGSLERRAGELKRSRDGGLKALSSAADSVRDGFVEVQSTITDSTSTFSNDLQKHTQALATTFDEAYDRMSRAKRARVDATDAMATDAQSGYRYMQRGIAATSRNIETAAGQVVSESSALSKATDVYRSGTTSHLSNLLQTTSSLVDQGTRDDPPTGMTPRKRTWEYVDQWEVTQSREVLLRNWRQQGISNVGSETFIAEHLPLPEGDSDRETDRDMFTDTEEPEQEDETVTVGSISSAPSLASSASSSTSNVKSSLPGPVARKPMNGLTKSGIPAAGALTESRASNVHVARGSKRVRR